MVGLEVLQWNLGMLCLKIWLVGVLGQWESPAYVVHWWSGNGFFEAIMVIIFSLVFYIHLLWMALIL